MDQFRVIEIKKNVTDDNDAEADALRRDLKSNGTFLLNLMSSPGSGKTTTLVRTIECLKDRMDIGVMEADIDSDVDSRTISQLGVKTIQLHTGGMCHLDADMSRQGLDQLNGDGLDQLDGDGLDGDEPDSNESNDSGLDLVVLENVGNLVCPAEFDTGAAKNAMILSVPEGDDKPLKYPLMFSVVDVLLINKIDAAAYFDFDIEKCTERVKKINPDIKIIPISAKTGEGMEAWTEWLEDAVFAWKKGEK